MTSPNGPAGTGARSSDQLSAAAPPRAAASRWEALLMAEGLNANGSFKPAHVLNSGAPLFVGATVRVARNLMRPHGHADDYASLSNAGYGRVVRATGTRRAMRLIEAELTDASPASPVPVGRVEHAEYEGGLGIRGVIAFDDVSPDWPLVAIGLASRREPIGRQLLRAWNDGHRDLLCLSPVCDVDWTEHRPLSAPPNAKTCVERIKHVKAVDLLLFPASEARLLEPLIGPTKGSA